jgi:hypothetical protein
MLGQHLRSTTKSFTRRQSGNPEKMNGICGMSNYQFDCKGIELNTQDGKTFKPNLQRAGEQRHPFDNQSHAKAWRRKGAKLGRHSFAPLRLRAFA